MTRQRGRRFRVLALALCLLAISILVVGAIVWINLSEMSKASGDVREARGELAWANSVADAVSDQANAIDGLVATADRRFISPYDEGQERLGTALAKLTACAADGPLDQRQEVAKATQSLTTWTREFANPAIAAVNAGMAPTAPSAESQRLIDITLQDIQRLRDGEVRLLRQRDAALTAADHAGRTAITLGAAAVVGLTLAIFWGVYRNLARERKAAEIQARKLAQALEAAKAAELAKTRFLANMSHEMRTPLNGVVGMIEALARTDLDQQQRELVEAVSYASATLDHLIGDLISLSRDGVAARLDRPPTRFNLGAAIRAVASTFIAEAATKGLRVEVETGDGVDLEILADVGSLGQILSSLLSNAVKFTEVGEVRISARGGDEGRYVFEVADTGVGFDAETYARILETFGQIDDSDVREHGGAGLGLAIARRLVGEFGGELAATSEPGVGSVFRFEIPLRAAEHEAQVDEPMTAPVDKAARVLIVDDNEMNRRVLQTILETAGLEYLSVADGRQAVEAASAEAFATILMDIQMPVMDGLTATREIRRLETTLGRPTCPVIMVSASCQPEYVAAGIAAGAQRHLAKPVNVRTLLGALSEVLAEAPVAA